MKTMVNFKQIAFSTTVLSRSDPHLLILKKMLQGKKFDSIEKVIYKTESYLKAGTHYKVNGAL